MLLFPMRSRAQRLRISNAGCASAMQVLFGEWCYARHTVAYSRLPALFIAFDIYNKRTGSFSSVAERERRLDGLGIPQALSKSP